MSIKLKPFSVNLKSRMRKPTFCIYENKSAGQLRSNCEADQRLCFCYMDSTILPKFQPLTILCDSRFSSVCNGPVRTPRCWFSHDATHCLRSKALGGRGRPHGCAFTVLAALSLRGFLVSLITIPSGWTFN